VEWLHLRLLRRGGRSVSDSERRMADAIAWFVFGALFVSALWLASWALSQ
jgi:hypothetical protein